MEARDLKYVKECLHDAASAQVGYRGCDADAWTVPYSASDVLAKLREKACERIPDETVAYYGVCRICSIDGIFYRYSVQVPLKHCTMATDFNVGDYDVFRLSTVRKPFEDAVNPVLETAPVSDMGMMQKYIDLVRTYDGRTIDNETRRRIYSEHGGK